MNGDKVPQIYGEYSEESKVIQVYFNGKAYLWHAQKSDETFHKTIFSKLLLNLKIDYKTRLDHQKMEVPIEKDESKGYELVGAGEAKRISENIVRYFGYSASYINLNGINLKHLEDIFANRKVEITTEINKKFAPSYLIKFLD